MKINLTALMNLISEYEKNFTVNIYNIRQYTFNTSTEELDGKVNIIEDNKEDFNYCLNQIEKSYKELSKLKTILYEKNNEFKLNDGRSIQQAIVDNTNLRKLKSCYEEILLSKNTKKRFTEVNNSYFECKTINFEQIDIRKKLQEIENTIQTTDFEISKLNSIEFIV